MSGEASRQRTADERVADVRRWLEAARVVHAERARWTTALVQTTGLTRKGVEFGFESLERDASEDDLRTLVMRAGDASSVHVILSSNVFVAPLRAIAVARAASDSVTVRPSARDPVLTEALVAAARALGDGAVRIVHERDVGALRAAEIHVYGRDDTVVDVRRHAPEGAVVRGHGVGMGVAFVTRAARLDDAADALARDVVAFDQRGCASPRVVVVEHREAEDAVPESGRERLRELGSGREAGRTRAFAQALHERLTAWSERVPRGVLSAGERAEGTRWRDALAFVGRTWTGDGHVVAVAEGGSVDVASAVPPSGRHVLVVGAASAEVARDGLAPIAPFIVTLGTDDPASGGLAAPRHARVVALGSMQRPILDGPLDRRAF